MAGAPNTTLRTKDEWAALIDNLLETAIAGAVTTTLASPGGTQTRAVTRAQTMKAIARRALRKANQIGMRREGATNPPVTPGQ
jgi:hypothetical protein